MKTTCGARTTISLALALLTATSSRAAPIAVSSYDYDGTGAGAAPSTSPAFPDSGPNQELTDGLLPAATAFSDAAWVGFRDDGRTGTTSHPQITFDFGSAQKVGSIDVTYLHSTTQAGGTITAPEEVLISVSNDNVAYSAPSSISGFDSSAGDEIRVATLDVSALDEARYYRLDFRNASQWTFFAEVAFEGPASGVSVSPDDFVTSASQGARVGNLATQGEAGDTFTYSLLAGEGDADNSKFQIVGDELQIGPHDFSSTADGAQFSIRVQSTGSPSGGQIETVLTLTAVADSDVDGLLDTWEERWAGVGELAILSGLNDANADGDSLTDLEEFELRDQFPDLDPTAADSDADGLDDGEEIAGAGERPPTDPTDADTDGDSLSDAVETNTGVFIGPADTGTNPTLVDTDGDTLPDGVETNTGVFNGAADPGSNPNLADTDGDSFPDDVEVTRGTDPSDPASSPAFTLVSSYVYDGTGPGAAPSTSPAFPDSGPNQELIDGLFPASTAFQDPAWVGFRDDGRTGTTSHPQVTFDFGRTQRVASITVTYLHSTTQAGGTITAPEEVLISVSDDDAAYSAPISFSAGFDSSAGDEIRVVTLDVSVLPGGRYYRLDFRNASQWTFITEVSFVAGSEQSFGLTVTRVGADLQFEWESKSGMLYNLRSVIDPSSADPVDWPVYNRNEDIAATPPINTLSIPLPADPERFFVVEEFPAPPVTVLSDDFEAGPGEWTVGLDGAAGTTWELGPPSLVGPAQGHSPDNCFGTNLSGDYQIDANVWLRSPAIDLTLATSATLSYWEFRDIEEGFDFGSVSVLDAADDSELAVIETGIDAITADWEMIAHAIPAEGLGKMIKIEFRFESDDIGSFAGWYIDDVVITMPAP